MDALDIMNPAESEGADENAARHKSDNRRLFQPMKKVHDRHSAPEYDRKILQYPEIFQFPSMMANWDTAPVLTCRYVSAAL